MSIKNWKAGNYVSCLAFVITVVAMIFYGINVSGGYWSGSSVDGVVALEVWTLIVIVASLVVSQINLGIISRVATGLLKIAVPILLTFAAMTFLAARVEGLGFILAPDENLIDVLQTPENMASVRNTIITAALYFVGAIAGMVAAFMSEKKA